jgi:uncharacterized membrane protein YsdA (DUF1294 family)
MKPMGYIICVLYLAVVNIIGFAAMGIDKRRAAARRRRIPERRLLTCAALGGSLGSLLGMTVFHHKTKHRKFSLGLPLIALLQLGIAVAAVMLLR